jgi:hypothetical protein
MDLSMSQTIELNALPERTQRIPESKLDSLMNSAVVPHVQHHRKILHLTEGGKLGGT